MMLNKTEIISALTPFAFVQDIADIQKDFEELSSAPQEILIRKKLLSLKDKPFYSALNLKKFEPVIDLALLYLAEHYPINEEDPITLETFDEKDYVVLTSGHRYKSLSLFEYFKKKQFKDISNPLTNQNISEKEMARIIKTIDKQRPDLFSSTQNQCIKALYEWKQSVYETICYFASCSESHLHHHIHEAFKLSLLLFPIINLFLSGTIMLSYHRWFISPPIREINTCDKLFLNLFNLTSLFFSQALFKWLTDEEFALPLPFYYFFRHNLIHCGTIIALDHMIRACQSMTEQSVLILDLRSYLLSYGHFIIIMHIIYPKHHQDTDKYIHIAYALISFTLLSNIMIKSYTHMMHPEDYNHQLSNIMQINFLNLLPKTLYSYFISRELVKIISAVCHHHSNHVEDRTNDVGNLSV